MKIVAICDDTVSTYARLFPVLAHLRSRQHEVFMTQSILVKDLAGYEIVLLQRPTADPAPFVQGRAAFGYKLVVDLDDAFKFIPKSHIGYTTIGPGNPMVLRNLDRAIAAADGIILSTTALRQALGLQDDPRVVVQTITWDSDSPQWYNYSSRKIYTQEGTVRVGWAGTSTHRDDFQIIYPVLERLSRDYPQMQIVIGGDLQVYKQLRGMPEQSRLYIPGMPYEDYPYTLAQFDILLAPLLDDPFNRCKSWVKLLEAGIMGIPWVASNVLPYQEWGGGGLLAGNWYKTISELITNPDRRKELGMQGHEIALEHRTGMRVGEWESFFQKVLNGIPLRKELQNA